MFNFGKVTSAAAVGFGLSLGCLVALGPSTAPAAAQSADRGDESIPKTMVLDEAPAGAKSVKQAREGGKVSDTVVIRGRIPAGKDAFPEGRAQFTLVDDKPANPAEQSASVQLVAAKATVLRPDVKTRRGLRAGAEVIVTGRVTAVDPGKPLAVNATGFYVVPPALPADLFLKDGPKDAKMVEDVKKTAKKGDTVAIRGRIGGSEDPFVAGRAVFTLVGPGIHACSDIEGDHCRTPWDYCCESKEDIAAHSAVIQVLDAAGAPLRANVKGNAGIKELSEVIVVGKVSQADGKSFIVNATGIHIVKP